MTTNNLYYNQQLSCLQKQLLNMSLLLHLVAETGHLKSKLSLET